MLAKQITFNDESDAVWESGKVLGMAYSVEEGDVFTYASKIRKVSDIKDVLDGEWNKRHISRNLRPSWTHLTFRRSSASHHAGNLETEVQMG